MRLSKVGKIYCVPKIKIHHDTGFANDALSWKTYYGYRNYFLTLKRHFPKYYYVETCMEFINCFSRLLRGKKVKETIVRIRGVYDALRNKQGVHEIYKSGWKGKP